MQQNNPGRSGSASGPCGQAMLRGAKLTCPACGIGRMFRRYLKVAAFARLAARHCTITAPTTPRPISPSSSSAMSS